jgi:hypothetical protein
VDSHKEERLPFEPVLGAGDEERLKADEGSISLSVATPGNVVKLERIPLTATVAEVVNGVRRAPVADWSEVAVAASSAWSPGAAAAQA